LTPRGGSSDCMTMGGEDRANDVEVLAASTLRSAFEKIYHVAISLATNAEQAMDRYYIYGAPVHMAGGSLSRRRCLFALDGNGPNISETGIGKGIDRSASI